MLALLAALLQGAVAVAIVGVAALVFNATAGADERDRRRAGERQLSRRRRDRRLARLAARGCALARAARAYFARRARGCGRRAVRRRALGVGAGARRRRRIPGGRTGALEAADGDDCGHLHAPDPRTLGAGFSWRAALATVAAAGARPCSGSLLILVFALAQGLFVVGVAAVAAVSLGTAITTGALASLAVFAKGLAVQVRRRRGHARRAGGARLRIRGGAGGAGLRAGAVFRRARRRLMARPDGSV